MIWRWLRHSIASQFLIQLRLLNNVNNHEILCLNYRLCNVYTLSKKGVMKMFLRHNLNFYSTYEQ
jgi:hypothetical protein